MSALKSAVMAQTCSAIRTTGKSLASLTISSKSSVFSRSVSNRFLYSSILVCRSRVRLLAGQADRDVYMKRRIVSCDFAPITGECAPTAAYRGPFLFNALMTAMRASISVPFALGNCFAAAQ
jgi:hypothetical protein